LAVGFRGARGDILPPSTPTSGTTPPRSPRLLARLEATRTSSRGGRSTARIPAPRHGRRDCSAG
jgi:hypothetical protein